MKIRTIWMWVYLSTTRFLLIMVQLGMATRSCSSLVVFKRTWRVRIHLICLSTPKQPYIYSKVKHSSQAWSRIRRMVIPSTTILVVMSNSVSLIRSWTRTWRSRWLVKKRKIKLLKISAWGDWRIYQDRLRSLWVTIKYVSVVRDKMTKNKYPPLQKTKPSSICRSKTSKREDRIRYMTPTRTSMMTSRMSRWPSTSKSRELRR